MDGEEGELADDDEHIHQLSNVDAQGEDDQVDGHLRGSVHEVSPERQRVVESHQSPEPRDASGQTSKVGWPPFLDPRLAGGEVGRDQRKEDDTAQHVEQRAEQYERSAAGNVLSLHCGVKWELRRRQNREDGVWVHSGMMFSFECFSPLSTAFFIQPTFYQSRRQCSEFPDMDSYSWLW